MVSTELVRRYRFFAGLDPEEIRLLAMRGEAFDVEPGHVFCREGDGLDHFYLVEAGRIAVELETTARGVQHGLAEQLTGELQTEEVTIGSMGPGAVFCFSALVPPYRAVAGARAVGPARVVAFDADGLRRDFEKDGRFGYRMLQKFAHIIRERLQALRVVSLGAGNS